MSKSKLEKLTNIKWLNLFVRNYDDGMKYYFASRRSIDNCGKSGFVDAVRVLPYFIENGKIKIVVIKNYRYAVENYLYELPAGCKDAGEDDESCAIRETMEETGAKVEELKFMYGGYTSAGLTDEYETCFEAKVKMEGEQQLEDIEKIDLKIIDLDEIPDLCKQDNFCLQSKAMLLDFYVRNKK